MISDINTYVEGKAFKDTWNRCFFNSGHKERSSYNPNGDIEIKITGLRPGEKLHEELVIDKELDETTKSNILKAKENFIS